MCEMGSWRSFGVLYEEGSTFFAQQCTECESHRLYYVSDSISIVGLPRQTQESDQAPAPTTPDEPDEFNPFE